MSQEIIKFNWSCNHTWKRSAKNTAWCLLGCAIGDFGTILFFQLTQIPFPVLNIMILAIINGLITSIILETIILMIQKINFVPKSPIAQPNTHQAVFFALLFHLSLHDQLNVSAIIITYSY